MPATKEKKIKSKVKEEFSSSTYIYWLKSMLLMRRFEEMAGRLYGQQKIRGFCHLYIGQEACASGCVSALREGDKYITAYRDHAHPLALGTNPDKIMAELFGKATGISKGKGGSMHMFDKEKHFFGDMELLEIKYLWELESRFQKNIKKQEMFVLLSLETEH